MIFSLHSQTLQGKLDFSRGRLTPGWDAFEQTPKESPARKEKTDTEAEKTISRLQLELEESQKEVHNFRNQYITVRKRVMTLHCEHISNRHVCSPG